MAKTSKQVQPYSPEFRAEAIRLARTSGKSRSEIARDLGMTSETLRLWLKQADLDAGKRHDGLSSEEREKVCRLRREVRILREERDILKKVTMSRCDIPSDENAPVACRRDGRSRGREERTDAVLLAMLGEMGGGAAVDRGTGAVCPRKKLTAGVSRIPLCRSNYALEARRRNLSVLCAPPTSCHLVCAGHPWNGFSMAWRDTCKYSMNDVLGWMSTRRRSSRRFCSRPRMATPPK